MGVVAARPCCAPVAGFHSIRHRWMEHARPLPDPARPAFRGDNLESSVLHATWWGTTPAQLAPRSSLKLPFVSVVRFALPSLVAPISSGLHCSVPPPARTGVRTVAPAWRARQEAAYVLLVEADPHGPFPPSHLRTGGELCGAYAYAGASEGGGGEIDEAPRCHKGNSACKYALRAPKLTFVRMLKSGLVCA